MRERLIAIIKDSLFRHIDKSCNLAENIADDLLENGVVALPCKVGDVVYIIDEGDECTEPYVLDVTVTTIGYDICGFWITMNLPLGFKMSAHIGEVSFGKTVFLSREEAERALRKVEA
jgi:hypothetical protein